MTALKCVFARCRRQTLAMREYARLPSALVLTSLCCIQAIACIQIGAYRAAMATIFFVVATCLIFAASIALLGRHGSHYDLAAIVARFGFGRHLSRSSEALLVAFGLAACIPVALMFYRTGMVPFLASLPSLDYEAMILLRTSVYSETRGLLLYLIEYSLRGVMPAVLFLCFLRGSLWFWLLLAVFTFFEIAVLAKIYVTLLYAPIIIYAFLTKSYLKGCIFVFCLGGLITLLVATTNPNLKLSVLAAVSSEARTYIAARAAANEIVDVHRRQSEIATLRYPYDERLRAHMASLPGLAAAVNALQMAGPAETDALGEIDAAFSARDGSGESGEGANSGFGILGAARGAIFAAVKTLESLYHRLFVVPAVVMKQWFSVFPERQSYLGLCGYRSTAWLRDCEFVHAPRRVFEIIYAETYVKRGIVGNLNAPAFITDFASFGYLGIVFSAAMSALVLAVASKLFRGNAAGHAIMIPYVALFLEAPVTMILNSGGLGVIIILMVLFLDRPEARCEPAGRVAATDAGRILPR